MREKGDFMSSTFTREKWDGSYRMILNLKQLNKHIEYEHFKKESFQSVLNIIRPNCWMASVDLKYAFYYTFPIHPDHEKFLKFKWQDASEQGWGATDGNTAIVGRWSSLERNHINVLELKAILLALKSYFRHDCNVKHVHILTDNSTALAYINNMGGMHSVNCNDIAKRIWEFAKNRDFWISSSYIPGVENTMADKMSRVFNGNTSE